jgi:trans-aconitate methyltransferase
MVFIVPRFRPRVGECTVSHHALKTLQLEWTKGTALRPYLDVLDERDRGAFLATYATRVSAAYPKQPEGRTLLPFNRIFLTAQI